MYSNLKAELKRREIKLRQVAEALGISLTTVWSKINGKTDRGWTSLERKALCELLGMEPTEDTYDYLFARQA